MRSRGFLIGSAMIAAMVVVSVSAFVETAYPVSAGPADADAAAVMCPSGASGPVSSCAEVHARTLAAGKMTRSQYELALSGFTALSAHSSGS